MEARKALRTVSEFWSCATSTQTEHCILDTQGKGKNSILDKGPEGKRFLCMFGDFLGGDGGGFCVEFFFLNTKISSLSCLTLYISTYRNRLPSTNSFSFFTYMGGNERTISL